VNFMKKFSKGSFLIVLPLIIGLWLWFSAESQPQNQPSNTATPQPSSSVSGQLNQPNQVQSTPQNQPNSNVAQGENQPTTITAEELKNALEAQVKENNPRAMMALGSLYEQGFYNSPSRHFGKAMELYQKAAKHDLPDAFFQVGICYEIGMGTTPDPKKAVENFQKAAEKGLPQAEYKLATFYLTGENVTKDIPKGIKYLKKAVDKNFSQALMEWGAILYFGRFEQKRDLTKAKDTFIKAADLGNPLAMNNLAIMSVAGEGMEANKIQGLKWYLLAQKFGLNSPEMQTTIDGVKSDMKDQDISQAETEAKEWTDKFQAKVEAAQAASQAAQVAGQAATKANEATKTPSPETTDK
jgi:TPR repeat protein